MNRINTLLLLLTTVLAVFGESAFDLTRRLLGAQVNLLPPLLVYASLTGNLATLSLVAVLGGLCCDALSVNPLGVSVLPLFAVGLAIHFKRALILREQSTAQWTLGLFASGAVPVLTLFLLLSAGRTPLLGWRLVWQWIVWTVGGGLLTPVAFRFFDWANAAFNYRRVAETSFRPDREIRRGRKL